MSIFYWFIKLGISLDLGHYQMVWSEQRNDFYEEIERRLTNV